MNERVRHIVEGARQLTPEERAELYDLVLIMVHAAKPEMSKGWEDEIESRVAEIDGGEAVLLDFDEAMHALRSKL